MWELLRHNGWIKFWAFAAAVVLFASVRFSDNRPEFVRIPGERMVFTDLPVNYVIRNRDILNDREIIINLSGPSDLMATARQKTYWLEVDASEFAPGQLTVELEPDMLTSQERIPQLGSIRSTIRQFTPLNLEVDVELRTMQFPVIVEYELERSDGRVVDASDPNGVRIEPRSIRLTGSKENLDKLASRKPPFTIQADTVIIDDDSRTVPGAPDTVFVVTQLPAELDTGFPDVKLADPGIRQATAYFKLTQPGE